MNKSLVMGLVAGAVVAAGAGAVAGLKLMKGPEYAEVLKVTPLTRTVHTPRQDCHNETVTHQGPVKDQHQIIGSVAGAVIGGVIGHQIGGGRGRDLATVAGAAGGGYAGNRIQKNLQDRDTTTTTEQKCTTVYDTSEKRIGYEVHYRLGKKEGTVKMDHDPGDRIPVRNGELALTGSGADDREGAGSN
ncbi:MAG TPA: glycine zipper 2TM domain-containing protein [Steroidobacteraceae bacterium]|nr:glycine zipper 2TM domain-containing protein [Steroidobacteraceae bacterium]